MNEKLIVSDELYGNIELEGVYKIIVESSEFQRLKDILQTGTSYLKYKEMKNETRFEHSVGSYYLMCKVIDNIETKLALQGIKINEEEKDIAKIAMLLHDIGHGAYSHTLEKITGYSHEKRSIDIVKDKNTQIHKILKEYKSEKFANKVGKFLEKVYDHNKKETSTKNIKIEKGIVNLQELLASLVSNNIDTDRLDYIVRDSKKADFKVLTEVEKLIESFEFVLDVDKIIVAIPEEKKLLLDMAILERTRNYKEIYFCHPSIIGDHVFENLLKELRDNGEEVPNTLEPVIYNFLTNSKAQFSTEEYMEITQTPINEALKEIKETSKNEKIIQLCNMEDTVKSYELINTDKNEKYIRYLLHKAIPQISEDTTGVIEETRWIKPYKSTENENINIITNEGIEDYKDVEQNLINLKPFSKKISAISQEIIRLEMEISEEEYENKYKKIVEEIISTVTKSKDEFEIRYVLTKEMLNQNNTTYSAQKIKEKIENKYQIKDSAKYLSHDVYYDDPKTYEFLKNKEAIRIREGTTFHKSEETYHFKKARATYKKYRNDVQSNFTIRRKEEQIGDSDNISEYEEFLETLKINKDKIKPVLDVNNLRYLYTANINGALIDISFNLSDYDNKIYGNNGQIATIEIKPRENQICDRLSLLELKQYLEQEIQNLSKFLTNSSVYEVAMLDTYEKYQKNNIRLNEVGNKGEER